jgi:hypothetical protein
LNQTEIDAQLRRDYPIFFMEMNDTQRKFVYITNSHGMTPKRRLMESGNKNGKTQIGLAEDLAHCWGKRYWLKENDPFFKVHIKTPNHGLIGCQTLSQSVMQKIWPTIKSLIPKTSTYVAKKNPMGQVTQVTFKTDPEGNKCESEIFVRSYDQDADTYEGIDYDWVHWDEPPPKPTLQAAERGKVVTNAPSWFTMTPLKEAYIYDEYSLRAKNNGGDDDEIAVIRGEIWDNCQDWCYRCRIDIPENHEERFIHRCPQCGITLGFMTKAGIDEYLKTLDPEEREAREKGLWRHLSGLVYKELDREVHLYEDFPIPKGWAKIEGCDPHDARPSKYLFGAISPEEIEIEGKHRNRIYFYDFILSKGENMDDFVRKIKMTREKHGYSKPKWVVLDAKYGTRTEMEGKSWEDELRTRGLGYIKLSQSKPGDVELGHKIVKEYIKPHHSTLTDKTKPGILFAKNACTGIGGPIHQMFNYQYKENADKPEEDFKDFPDIVRYICMEQPVYTSPESETALKEHLKERMNAAISIRRIAGGVNA